LSRSGGFGVLTPTSRIFTGRGRENSQVWPHLQCLPLRSEPEIEQFFTITYTRNSLQLKQNLKGVFNYEFI